MPDDGSSRLFINNRVPDNYQVLVVNPNGTPVSYPECQVSWRRAMKMLRMAGDYAFTYRTSPFVARSGNEFDRKEWEVPSVVMLRQFRKVVELHQEAAFNLRNLFIRDLGKDMYDDRRLRMKSDNPAIQASFDHITPKSRGGERSWMNSVLASVEMNGYKANRTPEEAGLRLKYDPWIPTRADLLKLELSEENLQHLNVEWLEFYENIKPSKRVQRVLNLAKAA